MTTACYFNGVRLWKNAKTLRANPIAQGAVAKPGMSRIMAQINNRSLNSLYEIVVRTSVPPVTAISTDYGGQATHHLYNLQTQKLLTEQTQTFGFLSWVVDNTKVNSVTGGPYSGLDANVSLTDYSGFTPLVGTDYLLRNPATGEGIVARAEVVGSGPPYTVRFDLVRTDLNRASTNVTVTSAWKVYPVAYYWPMVQYLRTSWGEVEAQAQDRHSFDVQWLFRSEAHPVWAAVADLDLE